MRFERRIEKLPVFDADVIVGVDATSAVILVNAADVPPEVQGRHRKSRSAAVRAARAAIPGPIDEYGRRYVVEFRMRTAAGGASWPSPVFGFGWSSAGARTGGPESGRPGRHHLA